MRRISLEIMAIPRTEKECADKLASIRWRGGLTCRCGGREHRRLRSRPRVFVCKRCRRHTSVTAGTLMHRCHLSIRQWLFAACLMLRNQGISAAEIMRRLKVTYETAWQLLHRLRLAMTSNDRIAGPLLVSVVGVKCGRPYRDGGPPKFLGRVACVAAAWGEHGVAIAHLPHRCRTDTWLREKLKCTKSKRERDGPAMHVLRRLWAKLVFTHAGVSERWLRRYVREASFRENGLQASRVLLNVLRAEQRIFDRVRPPVEPWGFKREWLPWSAFPMQRLQRHECARARRCPDYSVSAKI